MPHLDGGKGEYQRSLRRGFNEGQEFAPVRRFDGEGTMKDGLIAWKTPRPSRGGG